MLPAVSWKKDLEADVAGVSAEQYLRISRVQDRCEAAICNMSFVLATTASDKLNLMPCSEHKLGRRGARARARAPPSSTFCIYIALQFFLHPCAPFVSSGVFPRCDGEGLHI